MHSDLLTFVVQSLKAKTKSYYELERESGVPYSTLRNLATGRTTNPTIDTVERLGRYFGYRRDAPDERRSQATVG